MDITRYLEEMGGALPRSALLAAGIPAREIRRQRESGALLLPRHGWYASPRAPAEVVAAVGLGGRVSCASALRMHGVWVLPEKALHVAVAPGHGSRPAGAIVHTGRLHSPGLRSLVESPLQALERLSRCRSMPAFVVAADSAVHQGLVSLEQLRRYLAVSRRTSALVDAVDGRSESGTESLVRLALRGSRVAATPQVTIPGVGRVDIVVGDRLVVELDSWTWHSSRAAFEEDRRRDLALAARGYLTVRLTYRRVMEDWAGAREQLWSVIRSGGHRWSASTRRLARQNGFPSGS